MKSNEEIVALQRKMCYLEYCFCDEGFDNH